MTVRQNVHIRVILRFEGAFGKGKMPIISIFFQINDLDVSIVYTFKFPNKLIAKLNLKSFVRYFNENKHLLDNFVNDVMDKCYVISKYIKILQS